MRGFFVNLVSIEPLTRHPLTRTPPSPARGEGKALRLAARQCSTTRPPIQLSNSHESPPVLFVRRRVRLQSLAPSANEGRRSAERRTSLMFTPRPVRWRADQSRRAARSDKARPPLGAPPRRLFGSRPRFSAGNCPERQRAPRGQALVPGGRCPGAARVRRASLAPRPQAPHPAPSAERLRKTPLSEQGGDYIPDNRIVVKQGGKPSSDRKGR